MNDEILKSRIAKLIKDSVTINHCIQ